MDQTGVHSGPLWTNNVRGHVFDMLHAPTLFEFHDDKDKSSVS